MLAPNSLSHGERALGLDTPHLSEELRLTETAYAPYSGFEIDELPVASHLGMQFGESDCSL